MSAANPLMTPSAREKRDEPEIRQPDDPYGPGSVNEESELKKVPDGRQTGFNGRYILLNKSPISFL